jgi:hypothetical protein
MNHRPIIVMVLLVAVSACSGDDAASTTSLDASTTVGPTSTTVEPSSTTTAPSSTTTTTTTSTSTTNTTASSTSTPPATTTDSEVDWSEVVEVLGQRRQDVYAAPDVTRIPEVCGDASPCAEQLNVQIGDLADKGWRVEGADPFVVLDARVEQFDGDTLESSLLVTVVAVIERAADAGTIVDSNGTEVAAVEPGTEPGFNAQGRFLLGRVGPPDDPWRLISQDTLPEVPA